MNDCGLNDFEEAPILYICPRLKKWQTYNSGGVCYLTILTQKGFVEHKKGTGKLLIYTPLITKEKYRRQVMEEVKDDFFGNSFKSMFSFFVKEEHISADDIKELLKLMEEDAL